MDALPSPPGPRDRVYKDECMFSHDSPESPGGLFTSLKTWQSFGADYVNAAAERCGCPLFLKQVWKRVVKEEQDADQEVVTKMAIGVDGGFKADGKGWELQKSWQVVDVVSGAEVSASGRVEEIVLAILKHEGFKRATEISAVWEEEDRKVSKYASNLVQLDNGKKIPPDPKLWRCEESGMEDNLWLNLSTGHIGSGRRNWDGSGGTGAALAHFEATGSKYPLCVKLGTITPQGGDVYSYAPDENDMVIDPNLAQHLTHWGINMQQQEKTERTMAELQIDLNASYEFEKITESGSELVPLHGPGYVGLDNLGNSCYMASVLQLMFALPELEARYRRLAPQIFATAPEDPSEDMLSMTAKVAVGLLSDRYTKPVPMYEQGAVPDELTLAVGKEPKEYGSVRPFMFKTLIGKGHAEFSSARQQDASEFFQYLLDKLARAERAGRSRLESDPAEDFVPSAALFGFQIEDCIKCQQSGMVKYVTRPENMLSVPIATEGATNKKQYDAYEERAKNPQSGEEEPVKLEVPLDACLERFAAPEIIDGFLSPATGRKGVAQKRMRMRTYPKYLAVQLRKFYLASDWTPKKLDVSVPMPEELDLEFLRGSGAVDGEKLLPENAPDGAVSSPVTSVAIVPDPDIVSQLMGMGFSENGSKRAAIATKNSGAEASMEWVFAHMGDPDFNDPPIEDPLPAADSASAAGSVSAADVGNLTAMGFTDAQATAALKSTGGSLERAADWLFSHTDDLEAAVAAVESESGAGSRSGNDCGATEQLGSIDGPGKYSLVGFVSHMGSNTNCGHYVAHVKKGGRFVLYNDAKVAISQNPPTDLGFLYLYRRNTK